MSSQDGGQKPRTARGAVDPSALAQTLAPTDASSLTSTNVGLDATIGPSEQPAHTPPAGPVTITTEGGFDDTVLGPKVEPELKTTFEGYELLERLGEGGMGVVYKAYDQTLDRKVALKLVRNNAGDDEHRAAQSARVLREAQAMAKLSHPNVVSVYQVGIHDGAVFIAMEFVDGMTLTSWLKKEPRRWQDIVRVLVRAGRGLEAAHRAELVHRDFKPDNILIGHNNDVRVTDFGVARVTGTLAGPRATADNLPERLKQLSTGLGTHNTTGQILGTPVYMAPEQHRAEQVDGRADQFSFCVTLWEALFGARPFSGKTYMELSVNVATGKMAPMPATPRIPRYVRNVLLRGLSTDAKDRFPSMTELLAALDRGESSRRNIALAAIGVAGIGIGAASLALTHNTKSGPAVDPCEQPRAQVAQIWTPARRAQLEGAFKATGVGYAADAWQSTARAIDTYATRLGELGEESCRKHDDPGEQRLICFSNRRRDLDALLGLLSRADSTTVSHAVSSVEGLEDPRTCLSDAVTTRIAMPSDRAAQEEIKKIDEAASLAELNLTSGKYEDSRKLATDAVARARKVDHAPLLAKALLIAGRVEWQMGRMKEASDIFREAATVAERGKDDAQKARALTWNVVATGVELNDYRPAELYADMARASLERAGAGNEATQGMLEYSLGMMETRRGHPEKALELEQKALKLREQAFGQLHGEVGATLIQIGISLRQLERYDEALEQQQRAIKLIEGTYGAGHPFVSAALSEIGSVYLAKGEQDKAIATYEDVIKRLKASVGPEHPDVAIALNNIGVALLSGNDVPAPSIKRAIEHFEEALAIEKAALGPDVREIAESMQNIGGAQLRLGDGAAAFASLNKALLIYKKQPELPSDIGDLYFDIARAASLAKQPADAKAFAAAALKEYESRDRPEDAAAVREWQAQLR